MRLKTFLNIIIFVLIFPLIIFTTIFFYTIKNQMTNRLINIADQNLSQAVEQLKNDLAASQLNVEVLSFLPLFQEYRYSEAPIQAIQENLNTFFNQYQNLYERLVMVNQVGKPVFLINKFYFVNGQKSVFVNTDSFSPQDTVYFKQRMKSEEKILLSPPFLSESGYAIRAGILLPESYILFIDINLSYLCENIFKEYEYPYKSHNFIFDRNRNVIYSKKSGLLASTRQHLFAIAPDFSDEFNRIFEKYEGSHRFYKNSKVSIAHYFATLDWQIGSIVDMYEFLSPINKAGYYTIISGVLILIILIVITGWFSLKLTRSMQVLVYGAHTIAAGQFNYQIDLGHFYELQKLADDFNKIGSQMEKSIENIKKMDLELLEKKKVEEVSELKSQFISHVSHEMMTPLTAVKWSVENLLAGVGGEINSKQKEYLSGLKDVSDHLSRIFRDMLDLSRIEAGKLELIKSKFDLSEAVHEAVYLSKKDIDDKKIKINLMLQKFEFYGDRTRIVQIIRNILENAIKYSPEKADLDLSLQTNGHSLNKKDYQLVLRDYGPGITQESLKHIFDRFYKGSKSKKGIGLGLAIAQNIAKLHGGNISVKSDLGNGAEFTVHLPANIN